MCTYAWDSMGPPHKRDLETMRPQGIPCVWLGVGCIWGVTGCHGAPQSPLRAWGPSLYTGCINHAYEVAWGVP